jgi:hypothetical protein
MMRLLFQMKGGGNMADIVKNGPDAKRNELTLEEFSIVELEDRLEFLDRSNGNCKCPAPT